MTRSPPDRRPTTATERRSRAPSARGIDSHRVYRVIVARSTRSAEGVQSEAIAEQYPRDRARADFSSAVASRRRARQCPDICPAPRSVPSSDRRGYGHRARDHRTLSMRLPIRPRANRVDGAVCGDRDRDRARPRRARARRHSAGRARSDEDGARGGGAGQRHRAQRCRDRRRGGRRGSAARRAGSRRYVRRRRADRRAGCRPRAPRRPSSRRAPPRLHDRRGAPGGRGQAPRLGAPDRPRERADLVDDGTFVSTAR